jgi:hypothetical protein
MLLIFDEYRANAPRESERWATTNRGWVFETGETDDDRRTFAHYLDYTGTSERGRDGKRVHVVIVGRGVVWVRTCREARLAILAAYKRRHRR